MPRHASLNVRPSQRQQRRTGQRRSRWACCLHAGAQSPGKEHVYMNACQLPRISMRSLCSLRRTRSASTSMPSSVPTLRLSCPTIFAESPQPNTPCTQLRHRNKINHRQCPRTCHAQKVYYKQQHHTVAYRLNYMLPLESPHFCRMRCNEGN
jgi:hypothetical protein